MLTLKIVSPEKIVFEGNAESVLAPGTLGQFEVLTDHAPIISTLEKGLLVYRTADGEESLAIEGGFLSVKKNLVKVCVEI